MTNSIDRTVLEELLDAGLDDWVAVVEVGFAIRRLTGVDGVELCRAIGRTVSELVENRLFRPGTYDNDRGFQPLEEPLDHVLERICAQWEGMDDPTWWEVVWLDLTEDGTEEAKRLFPSRFRSRSHQDDTG